MVLRKLECSFENLQGDPTGPTESCWGHLKWPGVAGPFLGFPAERASWRAQKCTEGGVIRAGICGDDRVVRRALLSVPATAQEDSAQSR
jgi:hypothetical protein